MDQAVSHELGDIVKMILANVVRDPVEIGKMIASREAHDRARIAELVDAAGEALPIVGKRKGQDCFHVGRAVKLIEAIKRVAIVFAAWSLAERTMVIIRIAHEYLAEREQAL